MTGGAQRPAVFLTDLIVEVVTFRARQAAWVRLAAHQTPTQKTVDVAIAKRFTLHDRFSAETRSEALNVSLSLRNRPCPADCGVFKT